MGSGALWGQGSDGAGGAVGHSFGIGETEAVWGGAARRCPGHEGGADAVVGPHWGRCGDGAAVPRRRLRVPPKHHMLRHRERSLGVLPHAGGTGGDVVGWGWSKSGVIVV